MDCLLMALAMYLQPVPAKPLYALTAKDHARIAAAMEAVKPYLKSNQKK